MKAARDGGFDHLAQQLRDDRAEAQLVRDLTDQLTAQGVTVVSRPDYGTGAERLDRLGDGHGTPLAPDAHAACPGHAAYISSGWDYDDNDDPIKTVEPVYVCTDVKGNGHGPRCGTTSPKRLPASEMAEDEREQARQERRTVIANNKGWLQRGDRAGRRTAGRRERRPGAGRRARGHPGGTREGQDHIRGTENCWSGSSTPRPPAYWRARRPVTHSGSCRQVSRRRCRARPGAGRRRHTRSPGRAPDRQGLVVSRSSAPPSSSSANKAR